MKMNKNVKYGIEIAEAKLLPLLDQKQQELDDVREDLNVTRVRLDNADKKALGALQRADNAEKEALGALQRADNAEKEAAHAKDEAAHAKDEADLAKLELELSDEKLNVIEADLQEIRETVFSKMNMANKTIKETDNEIKNIDDEIAAENEVINFDIYEAFPKNMKINDSMKSHVLIQQLEAVDRVKEHEKSKKKMNAKKNKARDDQEAAYAEIGKLFVEKFATHNVYGELEY